MLINKPYYIKEATVVESKVIPNEKEKFLLNQILASNNIEKFDIEEYNENGVLLSLWSKETGEEYQRFLPESFIKEMIGDSNVNLKKEDLIFFSEQLKNRKEPILLTIVENEIESQEYQQAMQNSDGNITKKLGKTKKERK